MDMGKVDIDIGSHGRTTIMDIYVDGEITERLATSDLDRIGLEIAYYLKNGYDVDVQGKNRALDEQVEVRLRESSFDLILSSKSSPFGQHIEELVAELVGGAESGIFSIEYFGDK